MVSLDHISFSYTVRGESRPVFDDFSFEFEEGKITAVVGPSGCGKTTLLRLISGILRPQKGQISVGRTGVPASLAQKEGPPRTAFIFQDYGLLPWLTVERNAALGLEAQNTEKREISAKVRPILSELGLSEWSHVYPIRLSGGMQQRVAVARALAMDADLILMDEPFSSLDALTRESVQDMLSEIQKKHRSTIILVTHSLEEAVYLADRIVIFDGLVPVHHARSEENPHTWEQQAQQASSVSAYAGTTAREHPGFLSAVGRIRHAFDEEAERAKAGFEQSALRPATRPAMRPPNRPANLLALQSSPSIRKFFLRISQMAGAALFLILCWWLAAALVRRPFLPPPGLAFQRFAAQLAKGTFLFHAWASARRVCMALLCAGPLAWALGLLAGRVRMADRFLAPLVYLLHPLPKVAFLPLLMLFLGLGDASKVALMALVIFGQLFVTARDSAKGIPPALLESIGVLGFGPFHLLRLVVLPSTAPGLLSALRVSLGTSIAVLFLSETFASVDGLGWYIMDAWSRVNYPDMYAAIIALSLFGLILYLAIDALEAIVLRWRERD